MIRLFFSTALISLFFCLISLTNKEKSPSISKVNKSINDQFGFVKAGLVKLDSDTFSVQSFLLSKGEITNGEYNTFLNDLRANGEFDKLAIAMIDSSQWNNAKIDFTPMVKHYHSHEAFKNYPVVNITKEAAVLYCEWLTKQFNSLLPEGQQLIFRLPLKAEWLRAACGDDLETPYTWKGTYLRNKQGQLLANFVQVGEQAMARDEEGNIYYEPNHPFYFDVNQERKSTCIARSKSYYANEFDIYNMNGNVAELLADKDEVIGGSWYDTGYDIRNQSTRKYTGASPKVGFRVVATIAPNQLPWLKIKS